MLPGEFLWVKKHPELFKIFMLSFEKGNSAALSDLVVQLKWDRPVIARGKHEEWDRKNNTNLQSPLRVVEEWTETKIILVKL